MKLITNPVAVADLDRILELSKRLPVFPCRLDKKPLVIGGFHAASQDESQIRSWWRQWPDALVGVPTGQTTKLVVIDYDPDKANQATNNWLAENTDLLLSTRSHKTPRGGFHYLFKSTDRYMTGVDLTLGGTPRRGIDLRANGGYIIWWPAHLPQSDDTPVNGLLAGLIEERRFIAERDLAPLPKATPESWRVERHKAAVALASLKAEGYENWIRAGMAVHAASGGSDEGFEMWHEWSTTDASYCGIEDCRYHWQSFGRYRGRSINLGTLMAAAKESGGMPTEQHQDEPEAVSAPVDTKGRSPLRWAELEPKDPPERQWAIPHWLGIGYMTLLAGPGGVGKTLLAQQLASALAIGDGWFEPVARPLKVLMWAGEDDHDELWRRQWKIAGTQGKLLRDYHPNLIIESFAGRDCSLVEPVFGRLTPTKMMTELQEQVADYQADVVILDNVARLYGGDENVRHQVTQFVNWLSGACNAHHPTAQLLLAHPAKIGGSEYAGSTAWEAAVRSRWFFGRTPPDDENPPTDDSVRYLSRRKSNYSGLDSIKMDFDNVRLVFRKSDGEQEDNRSPSVKRMEFIILDFIKKMDSENTTCSHNKGRNNIASMMANSGTIGTHFKRMAQRVTEQLLSTGRICYGEHGGYANSRNKRLGLYVPEAQS